ncbi:MAG: segregation/condensation protein A, partial [Thermomicrobiales bacterium]
PSSLVKSLRRRLTIIPRQPEFIMQRRVINLRDLVSRVGELASRSQGIRFSQVVSGYHTRTEVATAFLAILVLTRRQSIEVAQDDLFGDIVLRPGTGGAPPSTPADHGTFIG